MERTVQTLARKQSYFLRNSKVEMSFYGISAEKQTVKIGYVCHKSIYLIEKNGLEEPSLEHTLLQASAPCY
jgi:hypothetical protein